jgi:hypothetical protein
MSAVPTSMSFSASSLFYWHIILSGGVLVPRVRDFYLVTAAAARTPTAATRARVLVIP